MANRVHASDGFLFIFLIIYYTGFVCIIYEVTKNLNIVLTKGMCNSIAFEDILEEIKFFCFYLFLFFSVYDRTCFHRMCSKSVHDNNNGYKYACDRWRISFTYHLRC